MSVTIIYYFLHFLLPEYDCSQKGVNYQGWTKAKKLTGIPTLQDCYIKCLQRVELQNCNYFTFHAQSHAKKKTPQWCRLIVAEDFQRVADASVVSGPVRCGPGRPGGPC